MSSPEHSSRKRYRNLLRLLVLVVGALHACASRNDMNPDSVSYLDVADAYLRGDFAAALNSYWSPLYSWVIALFFFVLRPDSYWEFPVLHLVNFIIYAFALLCYEVFLKQLSEYRRDSGCDAVPDDALWLVAYPLFLLTFTALSPIYRPTPDTLLAAFVILAYAVLLRERRVGEGWLGPLALGLVLGLGYLAKAPLFLLSFVFIGVAFFSYGRARLLKTLVTLAAFLAVAGPWVAALSWQKGRPTFGETGRIAYYWYTNGNLRGEVPEAHWHPADPADGVPKHTSRVISESPRFYEFATPFAASYPMWYDPSYWHDGVRPRFIPGRLLRRTAASLKVYYDLFVKVQGHLIAGFLILLLMNAGRPKVPWLLLAPVAAVLAMYAPVYVEYRFFAGFIVALWPMLFGSLCGVEPKRLARSVCLVVGLMIMLPVANATVLESGRLRQRHLQWEVAEGLRGAGLGEGQKVAVVGGAYVAYWPRLAKLRIVAEAVDPGQFWGAPAADRARVLRSLAGLGVRAVVSNHIPPGAEAEGWREVGSTKHYVYLLEGAGN